MSISKSDNSSLIFRWFEKKEKYNSTYINDKEDHKKNWEQAKKMVELLIGPARNYLCGNIPTSWIINESLPLADAIILIFYQEKERDACSGFAMLQYPTDQSEIYIDLVCARCAGKGLIDSVKMIAEERKIQHITLSAMPNTINFYRKLGFRHLEPCSSSSECQEEAVITLIAEPVSDLKFDHNQEAEKHKEFRKLLKTLMEYKLTKDKKCKQVASCTRGGYNMTYCVHSPAE